MGKEEGLNKDAVVSVGLWYLGRGPAGKEEAFFPETWAVGVCSGKRGFCSAVALRGSCAVQRSALLSTGPHLWGVYSQHNSCSLRSLDDLRGGLTQI